MKSRSTPHDISFGTDGFLNTSVSDAASSFFRSHVLTSIRFFIIIIVFELLAPVQVDAGDEEKLELVKAGYAYSYTSIRNVWCQFRHEYTTVSGKSYPFVVIPPEYPRIWAVEGNRFHHSIPEPAVPRDDIHIPYWNSGDGESFWVIDYRRKDIRKRRQIDLHDSIMYDTTPGKCLGNYPHPYGLRQVRGLTLNDLLETQPLKLEGMDKVGGQSCWKISLKYPGMDSADDLPMTVWFDPQHGYLPRRYEWRDGASSITVDEFLTVTGEAHHQQFFFPKRFTMINDDYKEICRVTDVKINSTLDEALFRPAAPRGFTVYDMDDPKQRRANIQKNQPHPPGTPSERREALVRQQEQRNLDAQSADIQFDAAPRRSNYFIVILLSGAVITLFAATLIYVRRRASRN